MITIAAEELYDERTQTFIPGKEYTFEHSLLSLTEWEHKYGKPFLAESNKSPEEIQDYMVMMCTNPKFTTKDLTPKIIEELGNYLSNYKSATVITPPKNDGNSRTIMTSEVIYAYMANAGLWLKCETWNLNRLLLQISTINQLNSPGEKLEVEDIQKTNAEINAMRRAKLNSKG